MSHIFISYSRQDADYANELRKKLTTEGFNIWIDTQIQSGNSWLKEIESQIDKCSAFIVIMTPDSKNSDWVQNEVARAKEKSKPIYPLMLIKHPVWFALQTTKITNVNNGNLPPASFYDDLETIVTRKKSNYTHSKPANADEDPYFYYVPQIDSAFKLLNLFVDAKGIDINHVSDPRTDTEVALYDQFDRVIHSIFAEESHITSNKFRKSIRDLIDTMHENGISIYGRCRFEQRLIDDTVQNLDMLTLVTVKSTLPFQFVNLRSHKSFLGLP
ncbi:MAG: toll/interleukin-1 receptor domain-containing protein [Chloroflexota bacterium]